MDTMQLKKELEDVSTAIQGANLSYEQELTALLVVPNSYSELIARQSQIRRELQAALIQEWRKKSGCLLEVGDGLRITQEFVDYKTSYDPAFFARQLRMNPDEDWTVGAVVSIQKFVTDSRDAHVYIAIGIGYIATTVGDLTLVERMRAAYLEG